MVDEQNKNPQQSQAGQQSGGNPNADQNLTQEDRAKGGQASQSNDSEKREED